MNNSTNRSHKKQPKLSREYRGFADAYPLVAWLNHTTDEEGKKRVLGLFNAIRQVQEMLKEPLFQKEGWYVEHYDSEPVVKYRALASDIVARCQRYHYMPLISPPLNSPTDKWNTVWFTAPDSEQWACEIKHHEKEKTPMEEEVGSESVAVRALITAHAAETLDKVTQCRCGKWIFRKTKVQTACSTECYQAEFKSNPEFKKERAKQARERYRSRIELEQGSKHSIKLKRT